MNTLTIGVLIASLVVVPATAQDVKLTKEKLVGGWAYVESYLRFPDGRRVDQFTTHPAGIFILNGGGWYAHIIMRPDLPRIKSGIMMQATQEEVRLIAIGGLSHYGTYTVNETENTFTVTIHKSDFPNFDGLQQTRLVIQLDDETMQYVNDVTNAGPGAVVHAKLRRLKEQR